MSYYVCPGARGLPGHHTRDAVVALSWARRYAAHHQVAYVVWELRGGRPHKLAEVAPGKRSTA